MKHPSPSELSRELGDGLHSMGLDVQPGAISKCVGFLLEILGANDRVGLTGITDPRTAVRLHLLDSLSALPELGQAPGGTLLDLGSGGGFPGGPLGIASGRATVLLDSARRKTEAVRRALEACAVSNVRVRCARAEDAARAGPPEYSAVVVRAVGGLPSLAELAAPLLQRDGRLIAMKGEVSAEENEAGDRAAGLVGLAHISTRAFALPIGGERRSIVVYRKGDDGAVSLPRRTGLAQRKPLA